ncbi:hypothetical protein [Streptomyces sp. NPDC056983]|uniref:hypothetical protein n=1 Tax=Streptomyces sp. NPDC056983 TaxID=3345987 RepID=UPI00362D7EC5
MNIAAAWCISKTGTPQRSTGRPNVSQLAVEADVKRRHLTHQPSDLKDRFPATVVKEDKKRATHTRSAHAHAELKNKYTDLQAHCRQLEERLKIYATAVDLLAPENAAPTGHDTGRGRDPCPAPPPPPGPWRRDGASQWSSTRHPDQGGFWAAKHGDCRQIRIAPGV